MLTFFVTILGAGILLPWIRLYPESIHSYFNNLKDWLRIAFAFSLCVIFTGAIFKLLSPNVRHLAHLRLYPPAWLAALLAWLIVATVDLLGGFDSDGYRASLLEWAGYGGGSLVLVAIYFGTIRDLIRLLAKSESSNDETDVDPVKTYSIEELAEAPWEEIEAWLRSDEPADRDLVGHKSMADKIVGLISDEVRSIGIVGPYGSGKSSITKWVHRRLEKGSAKGTKNFVCYHSCWGFATSADAIHNMLESAIARLSEEVDTFQVDSLPESYRNTFSAGGDFLETISNLVLRNPSPEDQFEQVSDILEQIDGRLLYIVEDLDRQNAGQFEIQEVLAFLERIKSYPRLSFVLTGGILSTSQIDFAKLCDHIEFLTPIETRHSSALINRMCKRCLEEGCFPYRKLPNPDRDYVWHPLSGMLLREHEQISLPQSVARLLHTPRSLGHALRRTYVGWDALHGEIDFDEYLAISVLRISAPEAFMFLFRHWDRLTSLPRNDASFGPERIQAIRKSIKEEWNAVASQVEWSEVAAIKLIEFILPTTKYWLQGSDRSGFDRRNLQRVSIERYWKRAVRESLDKSEVRDQMVVKDILDWLENPKSNSQLVDEILSSEEYGEIWEYLIGAYLSRNSSAVLLLGEQVLFRLLEKHGVSACTDSQGFVHIRRFVKDGASNRPENKEWLMAQIERAASVSIQFTSDLWNFFGSPRQQFVTHAQREEIRRYQIDVLRKAIADRDSLLERLSPEFSSTIYQIVFNRGDDEPVLVGAGYWKWLGPILLEALRTRNVVAAANCAALLGAGVNARETSAIDSEVLISFFGDASEEVIDILDSMSAQVRERDRSLMRNVVVAARKYFDERNRLEELGGEDAP